MADISVTATAVISSGASGGATIKTGVVAAATTITAGQSLYLTAASTLGLADANGTSPLYTFLGISLAGGSAGQTIPYVTLDPALVIGATLVPGDTLWLSATPGGITKTAADIVTGMYVTMLGVAISTTAFNLSPVFTTTVKP